MPNSRESWAAVRRAIVTGDVPLFIQLAEGGFDIEGKHGNQSVTLVMLLCQLNTPQSTQMLEYMLSRGASIAAVDRGGNTALTYASVVGQSADKVRVLLQAGADVNHTNAFGQVPLLRVLHEDPHASEIIRLHVRAGANLDLPGENGETCRDVAERVGVSLSPL